MGDLAVGDRFTTEEFGRPGDIWVVREIWEEGGGIRFCYNLTNPDEETFGVDEDCERIP